MGGRRHEHSLFVQILDQAGVCPWVPLVQNHEIGSLTDLKYVGVFRLYVPLGIRY